MENRLFRIGMYWRIFYGVLRTLLGITLLKLIDVPFSELLYTIMGQEYIEDPADFLFTLFNTILQTHPLTVTYFLSGYLIFWGVIDIVLSASLLRHKIWAFPVSLWLIGFFIIYELYRFTYTNSLILLAVIFIDIVVFWLIEREYKKVKARKQLQLKDSLIPE